jgi:hypothetical protein
MRTMAISSEMDTGSREENASKQKMSVGSDPIRTEKALKRRTLLRDRPEACAFVTGTR